MKKKKILQITLSFALLTGIFACKSDRDDGTESQEVLKSSYSVERFKVLDITPNIAAGAKLTWSIQDSVISENTVLQFISPYQKTYPLMLKVEYNGKSTTYTSSINVIKESTTYSKYISKVFDFLPAVGQFTNELPQYTDGNSAEDMVTKAQNALKGSNSSMISLGGFGGYVVFGFDHTIPNLEGRDFKILGNAFWGNDALEERSGSCEPGIILVAYDQNKNGKPDDNEWYEIAGSEYFKNTTAKNYSITYYKPDNSKTAVPGDEFWQTDVQYIRWTDNLGNSGYKTKNAYHDQSYYPLWLNNASYTLTGTRLANNYYDQSGTGTYWVGKSYEYGYADNAPNTDEASNIDISWAVDKNGNYVKLPGIDFVKVYTGINQEAGWLGEISTEVAGAYDLYMK